MGKKRICHATIECYKYVVSFIAIFIIGYITYLNMISTAYLVYWEHTYFVRDSIILNLFIILLYIFLVALLYNTKMYRRINELICDDKVFKKIKCYLIWTIFLLSVFWLICTQYKPGIDEKEIIEYAYEFSQGEYSSCAYGQYMDAYPMNNGLLIYELILFKLVGNFNYIALGIIISFATAVTFKNLASIGNNMGIGHIGQIGILASGILFFPFIIYSIMFYGNTIGLCFSIAAINTIMKFFENYKIRFALLGSVCIGFGCFFKQNSIIYFIAILIYSFVRFLRNSKNYKRVMLFFILLVLCFALQNCVPRLILRSITKHKMEAPMSPFSVVAMGLQDDGDEAPGWWNSYSINCYNESGPNTNVNSELAQKSIENSINNFVESPSYAIKFFSQKAASTWANPTFQCFGTVREGSNIIVPHWVEWILSYEGQYYATCFLNPLYNIILLGVILFLILHFNNEKYVDYLAILLVVVGGFLFHLVWETKARYAFFYFPILIPLSVLGYKLAVAHIASYFSKEDERTKVSRCSLIKPPTYPMCICGLIIVICLTLYSGNRLDIITKDTDAYYTYLHKEKETFQPPISDGEYIIWIGNKCIFFDNNELSLCAAKKSISPIVFKFCGNSVRLSNKDEKKQYITSASIDGKKVPVMQTFLNDEMQKWRVIAFENEEYAIVNSDGYALSYEYLENRVTLKPYVESFNQKWHIAQAKEIDISNMNEKICVSKDLADIQKITNFNDYFDYLCGKNCTIYIAVQDIQGFSLQQENIDKMKSLGFTAEIDLLLEKKYHSFLGIIINNQVKLQQIGDDTQITYSSEVDSKSISLESATLNAGNSSSIIISGTDYSAKGRGFNIVVEDNYTNCVVDSVSFDAHVNEITCTR